MRLVKRQNVGSQRKLLGLAYYSPEAFAAMTPEAVEALTRQCPALDAKMQVTGKMRVSASLGGSCRRRFKTA